MDFRLCWPVCAFVLACVCKMSTVAEKTSSLSCHVTPKHLSKSEKSGKLYSPTIYGSLTTQTGKFMKRTFCKDASIGCFRPSENQNVQTPEAEGRKQELRIRCQGRLSGCLGASLKHAVNGLRVKSELVQKSLSGLMLFGVSRGRHIESGLGTIVHDWNSCIYVLRIRTGSS